MAKHNVKCKKCGQIFDTNECEYIVSGRRYSHKICPGLSEEEQIIENRKLEEERILVEYMKEKYGEEVYKSDKTWVVLNKMMKEHSLDNLKLYHVLYYLTDVKKRKLNGDFGLIPYYWEEAEKYFQDLEKIQNINEQILSNAEEIIIDTIDIVIKSPQRKKKKKKLFSFLDEENVNE